MGPDSPKPPASYRVLFIESKGTTVSVIVIFTLLTPFAIVSTCAGAATFSPML